MKIICLLFSFGFLAVGTVRAQPRDAIVVGSKIFTESYILGELAAQTLQHSSQLPVVRKLGIGSTGMLLAALESGAVDVYPDYSGTLAETVLKDPSLRSLDKIREALQPMGLTISSSIGFNNSYALAVRESFANKYHLNSISDLAAASGSVRAAFSYEFMDRQDGYRGMVEFYKLKLDPQHVARMEHSLVYRAVESDAVDVIEVYSTDANIQKFNLRVLKDDKAYFPSYEAVWVARNDFVKQHPREWDAMRAFEGRINETSMRSMNAQADIDKVSVAHIVSKTFGFAETKDNALFTELLLRTKEHLWLVGVSLFFSLLIGIPLGVASARYRVAGQGILLFSALVQTIPTLALLCFLIPLFGVGAEPALIALCLYSLLPVVLNTYVGVQAVEAKHIENARALGLNPRQVLFRIVLPLASPTILAGLKTATIVGIGTATLAALIGAGGYGALIITGLSLNNLTTILTGAVPAAIMALCAHFIFDVVRRFIVPKGLRL